MATREETFAEEATQFASAKKREAAALQDMTPEDAAAAKKRKRDEKLDQESEEAQDAVAAMHSDLNA